MTGGGEWIEMGPPRLTIDPWQITWTWVADRSLKVTHMAWDNPGGLKIEEVSPGTVMIGDTYSFHVELK